MLHVIIATDTVVRAKHRATIVPKGASEGVFLDDMVASLASLEQYIYPSLFSIGTPVIQAKFLLEEYTEEITKDLLEKLVSSPTLFILEERSLTAPFLKLIEKEGGHVYHEKPGKQATKPPTIFAVTNALTSTSKKDRWLAYRTALAEHAPEAIIGILYWKLRQLIDGSPNKSAPWKELYRALMKAHKVAWQRGTALEVAIEKVILT